MAVDIRHFTATIAAGTPVSAPAVINVAMPPRVVRQIDWRVPPGPMGTLGWQIAMGGVIVFPVGSDQFVVADNQSGEWPITNAADSGAWQVIGYNTGANPHAVYLVFHCDLPARQSPVSAPLPLPAMQLAPDLSRAGPPVRRRM